MNKLESKDYKEANRLIHKATQYYNQYHEFYEKYQSRYSTLQGFKNQEDPEFWDSIQKQKVHALAHLEFSQGNKFFKESLVAESLDMDLVYDALDAINRAG